MARSTVIETASHVLRYFGSSLEAIFWPANQSMPAEIHISGTKRQCTFDGVCTVPAPSKVSVAAMGTFKAIGFGAFGCLICAASLAELTGLTVLGVVSQALIPKIGGGRCAAYEILVVTPAIGNLIREIQFDSWNENAAFLVPKIKATSGRKVTACSIAAVSRSATASSSASVMTNGAATQVLEPDRKSVV